MEGNHEQQLSNSAAIKATPEMDKILNFPPRREAVKGIYFPIFYEPSLCSGERICCAIVAISPDDAFVLPAPRIAQYTAIFGKEGSAFILEGMNDQFEDLRVLLSKREVREAVLEYQANGVEVIDDMLWPETEINAKKPILRRYYRNFHFGEAHYTCGNSIHEMAVNGMMMRASLYTEGQYTAIVPPTNEAEIVYCGQSAKVNCDRNCQKAWGRNSRPKGKVSDNPDDTFFYADHELLNAPKKSGTAEGDEGKPSGPDQFPSKWCVRECERCNMSAVGKSAEPLEIRTFYRRQYNIPSSDPLHDLENK